MKEPRKTPIEVITLNDFIEASDGNITQVAKHLRYDRGAISKMLESNRLAMIIDDGPYAFPRYHLLTSNKKRPVITNNSN